MLVKNINKQNKRISIFLFLLFGMIFVYGIGSAAGYLSVKSYGLVGAILFTAGLYYSHRSAYQFICFGTGIRANLHKEKNRLDILISCFRRMMQTYFIFAAVYGYLALMIYMFMYFKFVPVTTFLGIYVFGGFFYGTVFSAGLFLFFGCFELLLKAVRRTAEKI